MTGNPAIFVRDDLLAAIECEPGLWVSVSHVDTSDTWLRVRRSSDGLSGSVGARRLLGGSPDPILDSVPWAEVVAWLEREADPDEAARQAIAASARRQAAEQDAWGAALLDEMDL